VSGILRVVMCVFVVLAAGARIAYAQLNTQHIKGGVGLKAGSMPPPHTYVVLPLLFVYHTDTIRNSDGEKLPIDASITSSAAGVGIAYVSPKKILGGNYGIQILLPIFMDNRLQGTEIDSSTGWGLTDSVIQPFSLGWHFSRADAIASYSLYLPTGPYEKGASDNTGMGMWANEVSFGTTVYLTKSKAYHAATMASVSVQSKKEDSDTKVGNNLVLEGGIGGDFNSGKVSAGLVYASGIKLTNDRIDGLPERLPIHKNRTFQIGPEVTFALASKRAVYGFVKVNYQWEVYAKNTTQGSAVVVSATLAAPPIKLPGA